MKKGMFNITRVIFHIGMDDDHLLHLVAMKVLQDIRLDLCHTNYIARETEICCNLPIHNFTGDKKLDRSLIDNLSMLYNSF
jgi:hypothetical protein